MKLYTLTCFHVFDDDKIIHTLVTTKVTFIHKRNRNINSLHTDVSIAGNVLISLHRGTFPYY